MNKNENTPSNGSRGGLILALTFAVLMVLNKMWPWISAHHPWLGISVTTVAVLVAIAWFVVPLWNRHVESTKFEDVTKPEEKAVVLGRDMQSGKLVALKEEFRTMHMQVIGTTNAGKSESTVLPLAISDIENENGVFILDGKSDGRFIDKLYAYVKKYKREEDFKLFSLAFPEKSFSFNPLKGDSPRQVTERFFTSFKIENEYYLSIQKKYFLGIVKLIFEQDEVPTFSLVRQLLTNMDELKKWIDAAKDLDLQREMLDFYNMPARDREERTSGIEAMISEFTSSEISHLFDETADSICFDEAMEKGQILYFQVPTMLYPQLGQATGKLVLQSFQNAIAKRQLKMRGGDGTEDHEIFLLHP